MNLFSKLRHLVRKIWNNLFLLFQITLVVLLVALVVVFVVVMVPDCPKWIFGYLGIAQNGEPKYEALKFLGLGMGGVLVALQALMSHKRAKAMEDTAKSQADAANAQAKATKEQAKANLYTEYGQRHDRLKNAIEHLGHKSDSVRLGGAYELFHLAKDTKELRQTVLNILCTHIRRTTSRNKYRERHKSEPSEEIQSLLTLLFVQEYEVFKGLHINLQGSWLNQAHLKNAWLKEALLIGTHLQGADLSWARLQGASLEKARLQEANLLWTRLQGAKLKEAYLQEASLEKARLQEASLYWTQLQGAFLSEAHLQGAKLMETQLQGAVLYKACLQEASIDKAQLHGARSDWSFPMSFGDATPIKMHIGKETELSSVTFAGGLSQEDVESLVKELPDKKAQALRGKLNSHIGKPASHEIPENCDAVIGTYTQEEAERWIAK